MTPHIEAAPDAYSNIVLMPGDPKRARFIAENFLSDLRLVNTVRDCWGYTGTYKGTNVSVQASGIGQPSLAIYATELFDFYNVNTIIRIGTCGSFHDHVRCNDIVVADASFQEGYQDQLAHADPMLLTTIQHQLEQHQLCYHVGVVVSNNNYYQQDANWWKPLQQKHCLGVDMETYMLYHIASRNNKKALTVNLVSDNLSTKEDIGSMRVTGVEKMVSAVLDSI
jgi:purine-nucleoside phosphorylase